MKRNVLLHPPLLVGLAAASLFSLRASGAPLTATAAVHVKPDASSPVITTLKAGTDPTPASGSIATTPAGWMAVELPGPFEVYVENRDLTKALEVKPGANLRLAPKTDAGIVAVAEKGDVTTITGLRPDWIQVSLEKKLVGYIHVGGTAGYVPPIATAPATRTTSEPMAPAPVAPVAYGAAGGGQAVPMVNLGDGGSLALPRQFAGKFVSTRRPFAPRRPFDWALNDDAGKRYAYLDVSKLLQTEQIQKYVGHEIVVYGTATATNEGKDLVIRVESLQLK